MFSLASARSGRAFRAKPITTRAVPAGSHGSRSEAAAVLFTLGIRLVVGSGLDYRKSAIVGIATLGAPDASSVGAETSLRLLRHYASTVRHQKFRKADVVTITVKRRG